MINSYRKTGESHVIYCFDTDDFSVSPDHQANDKKIKKDLVHNSDIVWFNRDIEEVFINSRLENSEKKSKSIDFLAKGLIKSVSYQCLHMRISLWENEDRIWVLLLANT